jgi:hypothetical protein
MKLDLSKTSGLMKLPLLPLWPCLQYIAFGLGVFLGLGLGSLLCHGDGNRFLVRRIKVCLAKSVEIGKSSPISSCFSIVAPFSWPSWCFLPFSSNNFWLALPFLHR